MLDKELGAPSSNRVPSSTSPTYAPRLFDWADPALTRLTAPVAAADIAIFASPTYKAAYTGLLKAFLDRYGSNGLAGVTAVPVMTCGGPATCSPSRCTCARSWSSSAPPSPPAACTSPSPS